MTVAPGAELRHTPGAELRWCESWTFDFVADDGTVGGWARLSLLPNAGPGVAWYHAFVTGPDRQLVAVIDHEVPVPPAGLEIRTTGLWATHICETPLDHWTIGLEAFGLGVDDPAEIYGRQFGDRVPLGFDLEWEADALPEESTDGPSSGRRYRQPCTVTGELLVGREEIDLDAHGWREHRWGSLATWDARWLDVAGRLDDGTRFAATVADGDLAAALATVDGAPVVVEEASQTMAGHGFPAGARLRLDGLEVGLDPIGVTPLELTDVEERVSRAPRALCRCATADGRGGFAWAEWNEPQS